jgi:hypothetical protein
VQVVVEHERRDGVLDHDDAARGDAPVELEEPEVDQPTATAEGHDGRDDLELWQRVVDVEEVAVHGLRLHGDLRERGVAGRHGRHVVEDVDPHACLQPEEEVYHLLGNLLLGRPREDAQVRTAGVLVLAGVEDFPHPSNHGKPDGGEMYSTSRERERETDVGGREPAKDAILGIYRRESAGRVVEGGYVGWGWCDSALATVGSTNMERDEEEYKCIYWCYYTFHVCSNWEW